jgi:hypothetical protein
VAVSLLIKAYRTTCFPSREEGEAAEQYRPRCRWRAPTAPTHAMEQQVRYCSVDRYSTKASTCSWVSIWAKVWVITLATKPSAITALGSTMD